MSTWIHYLKRTLQIGFLFCSLSSLVAILFQTVSESKQAMAVNNITSVLMAKDDLRKHCKILYTSNSLVLDGSYRAEKAKRICEYELSK